MFIYFIMYLESKVPKIPIIILVLEVGIFGLGLFLLPHNVYPSREASEVQTRLSNGCSSVRLVSSTLASSRENLSSGFPSKRVSNPSPQLRRLARKLKFRS